MQLRIFTSSLLFALSQVDQQFEVPHVALA